MIAAAFLLAGLCCCGGAAVLNLSDRRRRAALTAGAFLILAVGALAVAAAGFRADLGHGGSLRLGSALGFGESALRIDQLSGLFLAVTGVIAAPVMLGFAGWSYRSQDIPYRPLPAIVALTLAGVLVVLTADNCFVFLFGWEAVSVAFYLLSSYRRDLPRRSGAGMLTFAVSKASGSLLLLAFALLVAGSGSFQFAAFSGVSGAAHDAAYALALLAFTAKVGVVPLQVWLPTGYAAAPGPARALMSAVAANIGFYGMWRTLQVLGAPPTWLVVLLLVTAAFTALLGIAHAAVQRDLQRVIAYSSVENGGLITAGFGVCLAGAATGHPQLVAAGLLAGTLQMITHALGKSALFLASSRLEARNDSTDLDLLRGAGRGEASTAIAFSLGAFTLAGLPLTVGFVSEWFLLEASMQLFRVGQLSVELALAVTGAAIALSAGYAGFTFVRLVGLTILGGRAAPGPDREDLPAHAGLLSKTGMLIPAFGCVGLAVVTPWEIRFLAHGLSPIVAASTSLKALAEPWVVQPTYAGFSALSPSWLAVELPLLFLAILAFAALASRGSMFSVRRVPPWRSATGGVAGDGQYTAFAFANAARHVLGNLLMTRAVRTEEEAASAGASGEREAHATYTTDVVELVEAFLYRPLLPRISRVVGVAKRLQSGRLDAYIGYMLIALVALLALVVALA
ncbi:MAG: proton-conducting transporter transmembrane domain-containing protein [Mycobacteriales bacterium]